MDFTKESNNCKKRIIPAESDDIQLSMVNKNEVDNPIPLDINVNVDSDGKHCEDEGTSVAVGTRSSARLMSRSKSSSSRCPLRTSSPDGMPNLPAKRMKMKNTSLSNVPRSEEEILDDQSKDSNVSHQNENKLTSASSGAVALEKLKIDVTIDPNVVDRYTDSGFTTEGAAPESPDSQKERIDIISRQCRLHPANKKYNQGPVENPPLVTPGKMVGYTPGGQRHEVDLNFDRPTWFNSEYARMQWDYATRINVTRMFHELETGTFLPDGLDPDIERRYFAVREMAERQAVEFFQARANASTSHDQGKPDDNGLQLLEAENELLDLCKYALVRMQDFDDEINQRLKKALNLPLTQLIIKKNPIILDTLEILTTRCIYIEVKISARALLEKIKGLFQVPENQEFREFFAAEVGKLKEKTKDMTGHEILVLTEEPGPDPSSVSDSESMAVEFHGPEEEQSLSETEDEWLPVWNGDLLVDLDRADSPTTTVELNEIDSDEDSSVVSDDREVDSHDRSNDSDSDHTQDSGVDEIIEDPSDFTRRLISEE